MSAADASVTQEVRYARELMEWDARIGARTDELMTLTRHNTAALNAVSELTAAQRRLEGGLTATRRGMFTVGVLGFRGFY